MKSEIKKNLVNDSLTNLEEALTSKIKFKGFHYLICFLWINVFLNEKKEPSCQYWNSNPTVFPTIIWKQTQTLSTMTSESFIGPSCRLRHVQLNSRPAMSLQETTNSAESDVILRRGTAFLSPNSQLFPFPIPEGIKVVTKAGNAVSPYLTEYIKDGRGHPSLRPTFPFSETNFCSQRREQRRVFTFAFFAATMLL